MGCAASSDRAEVERRRRLRERALGHSEASTTGLLLAVPRQDHDPAAWRRRGCKVAPEPLKDREGEEEEPLPAMPGSPSFRYYCQKAAVVDALVAEDDARRDSDVDGSVRITETSHQGPKRYELPADDTSRNKIVEASKPKQVTKWLKFRGLAIVAAAWNNLFSRHRNSASTPPAAAAAAKSHPTPTGPAPAPVAAARSRT